LPSVGVRSLEALHQENKATERSLGIIQPDPGSPEEQVSRFTSIRTKRLS
jgi:hypothetical protein